MSFNALLRTVTFLAVISFFFGAMPVLAGNACSRHSAANAAPSQQTRGSGEADLATPFVSEEACKEAHTEKPGLQSGPCPTQL